MIKQSMQVSKMNNFFKHLVKTLLAAIRFVMVFLSEAVGLLASSARTTPANDELNNSFRGGVMNHRTGKFDDGSDPAGWYERD
jgi:hypothetical protein